MLIFDYYYVHFGFNYNPISALIAFLINMVFMCIAYYAFYYMFFDVSLNRFAYYLFFFVLSMNWFLFSLDLMTCFIGWELLGYFSFLLISYWFYRQNTIKCAFQAFVIGRLGDFFLMSAAIIIVRDCAGILDIFFINMILYDFSINLFIVIFIFICASTKTTQFGLHIWLPNAMEGPIPDALTAFHSLVGWLFWRCF